ncbi:MAG: alanine--tRNA ligase, partial [Candidatus Omnitrophica bacterium]|nr:alanine--tRNA ligase [Candidatus Omnitrophota bacterium]
MKADILREKFLSFFKDRKHKVVESDSLVPRDDPTVLFTPAGMNQFKKQFLGAVGSFRRAVSSQRCLRTGDLENVGRTAGHHTFFEMLGNFSFGDYFKEEAIAWAWEFLTEELKIPQERFWVSVYKDDREAYRIWKENIDLPAQKIIKLGDKENFWPSEAKEKGPNGPCGPCSEIFVDQGSSFGCGKSNCSPACDCARFLEVWNLVFTQFNRKENGILEPLPQKNIDTGMGLERLAAVMQGVANNFETDLFKPLVDQIASKDQALAYAVADHIRAIVFSIYDGVMPSNEERGYVIRKLIRKSTLHLRSLGFKQPFLYKLVAVLSEIMRKPYPELIERRENIAEIILIEEKNFISTLNSSQRLFKEAGFLNNDAVGAAHKVFELYDTYGIPLELTKEWLDKQGIDFSQEVFDKDLKEQRARSKAGSSMKGDVFDLKELHLGTKKTSFVGYNKLEVRAKILRIVQDNGQAKKISKGEGAKIVLDKTPFYPESGGQVGDTGELIRGKNIFTVSDTKIFDKVIVHTGKVKEGSFKAGDELKSCVDSARRLSIARNHTATHLLQAALRKVLGLHVKQQGSLVEEARLRFDFTHFKDLSQEELSRVEETVNNFILKNLALSKKEMTQAAAKKSGALAFFGEKYGDKVRVVSISDISREFCGGTHLDSSGQIGLFKIIQELSVASGIRRIEAVTGSFAYKAVKEEEDSLKQVSELLNAPRSKLAEEIKKKLGLIKELEKQLHAHKDKGLSVSIEGDINNKENIAGIDFILSAHHRDQDSVRKAIDLIKERTKTNSIIFSSTGSNLQSQIYSAIGVTEDLCSSGIDASRMIKEIALDMGGSGGGRKDFAQAGGNNPENFNNIVAKLKEIIKKLR